MANSKWKKLKEALSCIYVPLSADESPPPSVHSHERPLSPALTDSASDVSMPRTPASPEARLSKQHSKPTKKTCAICLMSMKPGHGHAIFTAECSHSFHFHCITSNVKHGNQICPVCRANWKEIPFQSPISSNLRTRQNTSNSSVGRRLPPPRIDPNRHISSVFHSPESSVFNDDEQIDLQPELPDDNISIDSQYVTAIEVKTYAEVSVVSKSASRENFTILVHLKALPNMRSTPEYSRAPVDLVTVLDVSGSMAGTKLALLKRAMGFVIHHLGPNDRLSVVAFSSNARRLFPLRRMNDDGRQEALLVVNNLTSNGGTNIAEGLKKGVRILTERRFKNPVLSIILLSDGQDTYTLNSPGGTQSHTNYQALLPLATQSYHGNGLHLPVHAFGFGGDHDAAAMHSIAQGSGGTFSFIETESVIQDAFAQCIGGLLSVVVQELEVRVECVDPKLKFCSIKAGSYTTFITPDLRQGRISLGDLYAEEERDFLVTVDIPMDSSIDEMQLLKVKCVYRNPITKESIIFEEPNIMKIPRPNFTGDLLVSIEVDRQRNRLRAAEVMAEAKALAEEGNLSGAVEVLECFRKALSETVSAKARDPLCVGLAADIREMKERMGNQRAYESSGRAYVLSGMSSHSWQRATARGDSTDSTSLLQAYQTPSMTTMITRSQTLFLDTPSPPTSYRHGQSFTTPILQR